MQFIVLMPEKRGTPALLYKLELEKTCVIFCFNLMRDLSFAKKWINWVKLYISTAQFCALGNGNHEVFCFIRIVLNRLFCIPFFCSCTSEYAHALRGLKIPVRLNEIIFS
uniref:Putative ovule protein n=1 Tax=Solanum chacoense TaxID=4108 RepID=A0A0V0HJI8_SOLCH